MPYQQFPDQNDWQTQYNNFEYVWPQPQTIPVHSLPPRQPQASVEIPRYSSHPSAPLAPAMTALQNHRVLQDVPAPNITRQHFTVKAIPVANPVEELDYGLLLLTLAEEYLDAAHAQTHASSDYHRIVATALGCFESVLSNFRLPPLREAQVALRYAVVLFDETENNDDIEKVLTKSIELCEQNRFIDLKYTMQALLARTLHRSKPKAAVKDLQSMIEDVEAYRHVAWEYNFRFLSASLSLTSHSSHDFHSAASQLEKVCTIAHQHGDYAIYAFASIMLALAALQSSSLDPIAAAQRALANARQLQLNPDIAEHPQMQVLMEFIDLDCSLQEGNHSQIEQKMKSMQQTLYASLEHPNWQDEGTIYLPLSRRSLNNAIPQEGGSILERGGKFFLPFSWLRRSDSEVIGYLLSAASVSHKNASDGGKAEKYLSEGLMLLRSRAEQDQLPPRSMSLSQTQSLQRILLECCFLLDRAFLLCAKGSWVTARATVDEIFGLRRGIENSLPAEIFCLVHYLDGVIRQGTGDLSTALSIFQSATFALPLTNLDPKLARKTGRTSSGLKTSQYSETVTNISLLAAMNSILIVSSPTHSQHYMLQSLLQTIDPLIASTQNKSIQASYALILSTLADSPILKTKQNLGNALSTAQAIGNAQITALTLILMSDKFFKGVVGDQAMKCAKAASHQARRAGDPLWISVAQGMEAECLGIMGKTDEARRIGEAAQKVAMELPQGILKRR